MRNWTQRLAVRLRTLASSALVRQFASGMAWTVGGVAVERLVAVLQAFYVARLLGIEQFGKYGLIFVTIGLISSLAGLQLGMTAAVHVSAAAKSRTQEAGAIMRLCEALSIFLAVSAFAGVTAWPGEAARLILGDLKHADIVWPAAAIAALSVISGVQEGVLQGMEEFRKLSIIRCASSVIGLMLLFVLGRSGDLSSVIFALMCAVVLKVAALVMAKEISARARSLYSGLGAMWDARHVLFTFSLPAVLASLVGGAANWYGIYLVAHAAGGFRDVAVLTAGQQWRGLVLYLTTISASVAIPMMSRFSGTGDARAVRNVHRLNMWSNVGGAVAFVAGLGIAAGLVLQMYGPEFADGRLTFWLFVATSIPAVYANIYLQYLVSQRRMIMQLGYYVAQAIAFTPGYLILIPHYGALGFVVWTGIILLASCIIATYTIHISGEN